MSQRNLTTGTFSNNDNDDSICKNANNLDNIDSAQMQNLQMNLHANIHSQFTQKIENYLQNSQDNHHSRDSSSSSSVSSHSSNDSDNDSNNTSNSQKEEEQNSDSNSQTPQSSNLNKNQQQEIPMVQNQSVASLSTNKTNNNQNNAKTFDYFQYLNQNNGNNNEENKVKNNQLTPNNIQRYLYCEDKQTISTASITLANNNNKSPISSTSNILQKQQLLPQQQLDNSFQLYLDRNYLSNNLNKSPNSQQNSQAIAGAMRALQRKIKSLEDENQTLKDCFSGIQRKCVNMERSYQDEREQTLKLLKERLVPMETQGSSDRGDHRDLQVLQQLQQLQEIIQQQQQQNQEYQQQIQQQRQVQDTNQTIESQQNLLLEIEGLQEKLNILKQEHYEQGKTKEKYKIKSQKLKQINMTLQKKLKDQDTSFKNLKEQYQQERQIVISEKIDLERLNQNLQSQLENKDTFIQQLQQQQKQYINTQYQNNQQQKVDNSQNDKNVKKLQKYKSYIKELRNELKMLEKSHQVSQKALRHTEQFVDEVVHVNDKLVHSLAKNKTKLRSLSNSQKSLNKNRLIPQMQATYDQRQQHMKNDSMNQDAMNVYDSVAIKYNGNNIVMSSERIKQQKYGQLSMNPSHSHSILLTNQKSIIPNLNKLSQIKTQNEQQMYDSLNNRESNSIPQNIRQNFNSQGNMNHNIQHQTMTVQKVSSHQQLVSNQTTIQKPPKSTRNMQRCFSFSKGFYPNSNHQQVNQNQNVNYKYQQPLNQTHSQKYSQYNLISIDNKTQSIQPLQNSNSLNAFIPITQHRNGQQQNIQQQQYSLETSRFQIDEEDLNNCTNIISQQTDYKSHYAKSHRSMKTTNGKLKSDFSLKPYEEMINQVSQKIDMMEQDITTCIQQAVNNCKQGNTQQSTSQSDLFLQMKQEELIHLRKEHDTLVKNIRERSIEFKSRGNNQKYL